MPLRRELPAGTVTFVFTDIELSTRLAHDLGTARWGDVLEHHAAIIRAAAAANDGVEVRTEGDSFFLVFRGARQAVAAAAQAQRALQAHAWPHGATVRVRIGIHTGEGTPAAPGQGTDYVGYAVHRAARVAAAGHGGQVLLSSATKALVDELPDGANVRDLGEHRLKDMSQPERLYQLVIEGLPEAFPRLRTLDRVPHDLPVQLTSFIGRQKELAEAKRLLVRTRLLTLVGPGGTGKSRLGLQLAADVVDEYPDGVWFVRLAPITDPSLVASTIAHTLGLVVPPSRTPLQQLVEHLREKRVLLLLDNFEHVVRAAPDVAELLREAPMTKAIVSSRAALRVSGEQEYPVPPLTLPDPNDVPDVAELSQAEAIQLFVERARAARPAFMLAEDNARAVVGIVAQLDGLPLAIELAAARVKILPPQAILERLASGLGILQSSARDVTARQQTLRGAIGWSYDLLDPGLRRAFERLAVFRGGGELEQIERVVGPSEEMERDVLDALAELVDQSLLRQMPSGAAPRFVMLETIREYARERLDQSGEAREIERRHAEAYRDLAERAAPRLYGSRQGEWLDRLELEHGNLRAAMDRSCDGAAVETALRLVAALWRFWQMRGHLQEGRQRAERALALPGVEEFGDAYIRALEAAGGVAYWQGDMAGTSTFYEKRLALARATAADVAIANAMYDLSFVYLVPNVELERADELLQGALERFRAANDRGGIAKTLWAVSSLAFQRADLAAAAAVLPEVIDIFREMDDRFGLGWALHSMGIVETRLSRYDRARATLEEGLRIFLDANDSSGIVLYLWDFAEVVATMGDAERAIRLFGAMSALMAASGSELANQWQNERVEWGRAIRELMDRTDATERERLLAEGAAMGRAEAIAYAIEHPSGSKG